jgi:uncharacterized GH25 family protein
VNESPSAQPTRPVPANESPTAERTKNGAIAGVVRDTAGRPVQGAEVSVESVSRPALGMPAMAQLTDACGRFDWTLSIVRYDLKLWIGSGDVSAAYLPG